MKKDFIFIIIMTLAGLLVAFFADILHYIIEGDFLGGELYFMATIPSLCLGVVTLFIVQPVIKWYSKTL